MNWYKVTFPQTPEGAHAGAQLQDAFMALYIAAGGPREAALFTNDETGEDRCSYYFSLRPCA